jgi:hypothetical protein
MLLLMLVSVGALAVFVSGLNRATLQLERDRITAAALAQAKEALIGYAASVAFSSGGCGIDCPRPGDLPCPDNWPQGSVNEGSPSACAGNAIGRLPWKRLGLPDLRDASGERLWYAVSANYKNSNRVLPLNSDALGTISVSDPGGMLIADATSGSGVAAVVIAPGGALTRQDGVAQDRSGTGYNNSINYLDVANGEDNQNFINGTNNGFIQGPIKDSNGAIILNDTLIIISRDDVMRVAEKRVLKEVINALSSYYLSNASYPNPADFSDATCLGNGDLDISKCKSGLNNRGRIPANPLPAWVGSEQFFLKGTKTDNWFQQNAWREVIYYATGSLNLNNPPGVPITGRQALVIMTGSALAGQNRPANKGLGANYLEDENLTPLDDTYTLRPASTVTPFNDKVRCLPSSSPNC